MSNQHPIQVLAERHHMDVQSYSGRGMYGNTCLGISTDAPVGDLLADIILSVGTVTYTRESFAEDFRRMQQDSMGMGTIYYFPHIPFKEG